MRVCVVGGRGYVGRLFVPGLAAVHDVRVLDISDPGAAAGTATGSVEHLTGDATDPGVLRAALTGMDAVVHAAMGGVDGDDPAAAGRAFDVNVTSVHLTLLAARRAGATHAVHLSSLSVFDGLGGDRVVDEDTPPDAMDLYGLTKRLGEQVCRAAARAGMSVNVLRLAWPTPDACWPRWARVRPAEQIRSDDGTPILATAGSDLTRAVLAALRLRAGFQIFTITGDDRGGAWSTRKARDLLGWAPTRTGPAPPARVP